MMYKTVFFGYIAAAVAVVAALVLIMIMLIQNSQYERKKLQSLAGVLFGSICMNTLYFLSFFDSLTSLTALYAPLERCNDILLSFVINLFLFLFLFQMGRENRPGLARAFRPTLIILIAAFTFAAVIYLTVVTDQYRVSGGHLLLAETAQIILTAVICLVTGIFTWTAIRPAEGAEGKDRLLVRSIAGEGIVNIVTAVYNAAGSIVLFHNSFDYLKWCGPGDMNTWLFVLSDILILMIVVCFYRAQDRAAGPAFAEGEGAAAASVNMPAIPPSLGLTPRETEIAERILQRQTYREIAEELTISEHTVKRHVHNIYEKAGVSRRDELIRKLKETE